MADTSNNKPGSSFEARFRGKLKGGFGNLDDSPQHTPDATSSTTEADTIRPLVFADLRVRDIEELDRKAGYDPEYEGQPADSEGYHKYSRRYTGPRMLNWRQTNVYNPGDPNWLEKTMAVKKLPGVYSPEGYIWGRDRNEVYYIEFEPGIRKSGSLSIAFALDKGRLGVFTGKDGEMPDPEEFPEELFDNPEYLKLMCGEPLPFFERPYDLGYTGIVWLQHAGPGHLDQYIPPSELPRWLYVYDEDDITLPGSSDEVDDEVSDELNDEFEHVNNIVQDEIDWFGIGRPIFEIPPHVKPFKYRLIDPTGKNVSSDEEPVDPEEDHATLILSKSRVIPRGPSEQYEAQISLQDRSKYPYRLRVAAKLTHDIYPGDLLNEATMYNLFPDYFSREYSGVQLVTPSIIPRSLSKVVPSFYGYYQHVPDEVGRGKGKGKERSSEPINSANTHEKEDAEEGQKNEEQIVRRSILLTEYCGHHINPRELTQYQKLNIISLLDRFHNAGFILGSVTCRHILIQPGPNDLFAPLCQTIKPLRTWGRPSFRLDHFRHTSWCGLKSERERVESEYGKSIENNMRYEKERLKDQILVRGY